jgi:hypothetical protein
MQSNSSASFAANEKACINFPSAAKIAVSVKTGASEAEDRIPVVMQTTLRCAENVVIFSDLEQDVGQYHLYDALDAISPSVTDGNPDFDFYRQQRDLWQSEKNISSLKGAMHPYYENELAAWTLDKYKNLHMIEKTWALKPDMDWYIFIDADTYVFWSNLVMWLETMDPTKKSYIGAAAEINDQRFAHGGTGIILSKAAVYDLVVRHNGTAAHWDPHIHEHCCGDYVLAMALKDCGTKLRSVYPYMSGEALSSIPFGPGTTEYWCRPAVTMHHLTTAEMGELVDFERQWLNVSVRGLLLTSKAYLKCPANFVLFRTSSRTSTFSRTLYNLMLNRLAMIGTTWRRNQGNLV